MNTSILDEMKDAICLLEESKICAPHTAKVLDLQKRLRNRELTIAVIGQFKRGKTTLINSILGADILPVGIVPITSAVTKIKYGLDQAAVSFQHGGTQQVPLTKLDQYISEQENPDNKKGVSFVTLYYPCDLLKDGLTIVDTPGVGSVHKLNTDVAYSFIKESDAVIFMLSVDSPINEIEREFLFATKQYTSKFYFAVNKVDVINEGELTSYLRYCESLLRELMDTDSIRLFPISAKVGTGIPELLSAVRRDIQLSIDEILTDSIRIKFGEVLNAAMSQIELYLSALNMPVDNLEKKRLELVDKLADLDRMSQEAYFRIERHANSPIKKIEKDFALLANDTIKDMTSILQNVYKQNTHKRPRVLENELKTVLETNSKCRLAKINDTGLDYLRSGYEEMANLLVKEIEGMKAYLAEVIRSLFGVDYRYEKTSHTLSERSDFYIRLGKITVSFFIEKRWFIYLMPRRFANRKIASDISKEMKDNVSRNLTNMVANYRYKIRESIRSFSALFRSETETLKADINKLLERVTVDKETTSVELKEKNEQLKYIHDALHQIIVTLDGESN